MLCALEKTVMTEVSGHISELVNVITVFHHANSDLYTITNIYPKAGMSQKAIAVFQSENVALFTVFAFTASDKAKKQKLGKKMKSDL